MIRLYSGTPGSGKSLHNAKDVINRSRFGKPVIGNFPCDLSKYPKANYTYVPNYELTPDYLMNYSREYFKGKPIRKGKILLVIDECQLMFNSRDWQQKGRNAWLSFFTQHRKFGYDVTLIAQFDRMIDKQLRGVIEYEYVHRKLSNKSLFMPGSGSFPSTIPSAPFKWKPPPLLQLKPQLRQLTLPAQLLRRCPLLKNKNQK